uniref:PSI domain-containing protein n=1 Tax=Plectus sambesii TaxID=2011161 RepID=A0A914UYS7_9BILA
MCKKREGSDAWLEGVPGGQAKQLRFVDPQALPFLLLLRGRMFTFVLIVSKVKVRQCDDLAVCTTCLEQRDPYCGWCVLDNKCTPESVCRKSGVASSSAAASVVDWLSYKTGQCTTIRSVEPNQLQITAASFLTLKLDNLPNVAGDLTCQFRFPSGLELSMAAESKGTEVEGTLRCPTPGTPLLPSIPSGEHSLLARLSV